MSLETELREVFDTFDEDKNGGLSLEELKLAISFCRECKGRPGYQNEALVVLLTMASKVENGGEVSFEDFIEINARLADLESGESDNTQIVLTELFQIYDTDNDGKISRNEILRIHKFLGVTNDLDTIVELNFEEFKVYILQNI